MKRFRGIAIMLAISMGFSASLFWLLQSDEREERLQDITISVVLYGENQNRWKALDQGIQQACNDLNIEKPLVHISGNYQSATQKNLLGRQIAEGADGVLIAPCNSTEMQPYLETIGKDLPLVAVENSAGVKIPYLSADNGEMGRQLAEKLKGSSQKIVLLDTGTTRENVNLRRQAFLGEMEKNGTPFTLWSCTEAPPNYIGSVSRCMEELQPDILVALDTESLESTASIITPGGKVKVYGIGGSEKVVFGLDSQTITEVCFQNEFSIGYLATLQLAAKLGKYQNKVENTIEYQIVNYENMYLPASERLLFPMIQ